MRAAIDIGSNTVRLLIGEVHGGRVQVKHQQLFTTRLGETAVGGRLSLRGRSKTIAALKEFAAVMQSEGVREAPIVAATSAVREAADGADFQAEVQRELGWDLRILSGEEEAACSYAGAASVGQGDAAIIDVGGGSTELICRQPDGTIRGRSVKVGAVRLYLGEVQEADLPVILSGLLPVLPRNGKARQFISVGGTITLLAALLAGITVYSREAVSGRVVTLAELQNLQAELLPLLPAERLQKYPMLSGREDVICAGITIYLQLAALLQTTEFVASDAGLLDRLLLQNQ